MLISSVMALGALPAVAGSFDAYPTYPGLGVAGAVNGNSQSAPGFGDGGSWQATGAKVNFYATPLQLFGTADVKISEISSMTYWTNQLGSLSSNWNLYIYTSPTGTDDSASWYKSTLVGIALDGPTGWDQQTTGGTDALHWTDANRNNTSYTTNIAWADIEGGSVTWPSSGSSRDYRNETVKFFSLQTDSGATGFRGLVDGLTVNLSGDRTASVNFEPVPEPATWSLFAIGAGLVGLARRYHR